jgi:hypothetical protein
LLNSNGKMLSEDGFFRFRSRSASASDLAGV